jgi:hypothetical protein
MVFMSTNPRFGFFYVVMEFFSLYAYGMLDDLLAGSRCTIVKEDVIRIVYILPLPWY